MSRAPDAACAALRPGRFQEICFIILHKRCCFGSECDQREAACYSGKLITVTQALFMTHFRPLRLQAPVIVPACRGSAGFESKLVPNTEQKIKNGQFRMSLYLAGPNLNSEITVHLVIFFFVPF